MAVQKIGAGSVSTQDVRDELTQQLPKEPHFVVRSAQQGPLALTSLSLDTSLLLPAPIQTSNGWLVAPITKKLREGQRLGGIVFAGFDVPGLAAYLVINSQLKYLSHTKELAAGRYWRASTILRPYHLT